MIIRISVSATFVWYPVAAYAYKITEPTIYIVTCLKPIQQTNLDLLWLLVEFSLAGEQALTERI